MKTDEEIKDDIYALLKGSDLEAAVSGELRKTQRQKDSDAEDIIISVLDSNVAQWQMATVNVNIYVPDIHYNNGADEDCPRLRELSRMAAQILQSGNKDDFKYKLVRQRVFKNEAKDEHFINNRVEYRHLSDAY